MCPKPKHIPITGTKSQNLFPNDADTGRPVTDIQVGDIVFIESQSSQSPYIKLGTMSKWTHCGVVVDTPDGLKAPVQYRKYLGQPYDLEFRFDNGKMYCSELVWLVYKDQGIELCDPRKVSSFVMARVPKVKSRDKMTMAVNLDMGRWGYGWIGKRTLCPWAIVFRHWQTNWIYSK